MLRNFILLGPIISSFSNEILALNYFLRFEDCLASGWDESLGNLIVRDLVLDGSLHK